MSVFTEKKKIAAQLLLNHDCEVDLPNQDLRKHYKKADEFHLLFLFHSVNLDVQPSLQK